MKVTTFIMALATALFLGGCYTVEEAVSPDRRNAVIVRNYGWFLFDSVPLVCGDTSELPGSTFTFFTNEVTHEHLQHALVRHSRRLGSEGVRNVSWHTTENVLFTIPGISFPLPIPYLLVFREMQISGVRTK